MIPIQNGGKACPTAAAADSGYVEAVEVYSLTARIRDSMRISLSYRARPQPGPSRCRRAERRTTVDYDLLVIGAGTAGSFAARTAVGLGARTAIAEQDGFASTCLGTG